jgi:hypothetical protein
MKNYSNLIFIILFSLQIFSCKKERITKDHVEFIGDWSEETNNTTYHKLHIQNQSKGVYSIYNVGNSDSEDHQFRKWRIKDNHLYYGIQSDLGEISQYPITASTNIPLGFGNDTIKVGTVYMVLNHNYYVEGN